MRSKLDLANDLTVRLSSRNAFAVACTIKLLARRRTFCDCLSVRRETLELSQLRVTSLRPAYPSAVIYPIPVRFKKSKTVVHENVCAKPPVGRIAFVPRQ